MGSTNEKIPQAEDSARYGRIILLLTIVTIVFLPMSFLATWFGMNIKNPTANNLNLHQIAAIIFPISMVIVLSALVFAFSERLRSFVADAMQNVLDFVLRALGINRSIRSRTRRPERQMRGQQRDIDSGIVDESHEFSVMAENCRY